MNLFVFILNFLISFVGLYVIGSIFKVYLPVENKYQRVFQKFFIGSICFALVAAILVTNGHTYFLLIPVLYAFYYFNSTKKFNKQDFLLNLKEELPITIYLFFIGTSVLIFNYYNLFNLKNEWTWQTNYDYNTYALYVENLFYTKKESVNLNWFDMNNIQPTIYHYYDLWLVASFKLMFGINAYCSYFFIAAPIISIIFVIGIFSLLSNKITNHKWMLILAPLLFVISNDLIFISLLSKFLNISCFSGGLICNYKLVFFAVIFVWIAIEYEKNKHNTLIVLLICCVLFTSILIVLVAIFGILLIYLLKTKEKNKLFFITTFILTIICCVVFYLEFLNSSEENGINYQLRNNKNSFIELFFSIKYITLFRNITIGVTLINLCLFNALFIYNKLYLNNKTFLNNLLLCFLLNTLGTICYGLINIIVDSVQFWLCVVMFTNAYILFYALLLTLEKGKSIYSLIFIVYFISCCYKYKYYKTPLTESYTCFKDKIPAHLNQSQIAICSNPGFEGYLAFPFASLSLFVTNLNITYISIFDLEFRKSYRDDVHYNTLISDSQFYSFCKKANPNNKLSIVECQVLFLKEYNYKYLIQHKDYRISKEVLSITNKIICKDETYTIYQIADIK